MIAFDTNLLVRALVDDHPEQVAVVRQLIASDSIFISRTVLLETEWVLRARYKKTRDELGAFFSALLEVDNTVVEDAEAVSHALEWYAQGADFADALHLARANFCKTFLSFDQRLKKRAKAAGISPAVETPTA